VQNERKGEEKGKGERKKGKGREGRKHPQNKLNKSVTALITSQHCCKAQRIWVTNSEI